MGLQRFEGVLLRYLSDAYRALSKSVPVRFRSEAVEELVASLGAVVRTVDSSLLEEWEEMRAPTSLADALPVALEPKKPRDPAADPRAFAARIRAELHRLLGALARRDFDEARAALRDGEAWTPERLSAEIAPYFAEHEKIIVTPLARSPRNTTQSLVAPRIWEAQQMLVDPAGDEDFAIHARVDLSEPLLPGQENAPLIELQRIGR
jgi:hypothetical protein